MTDVRRRGLAAAVAWALAVVVVDQLTKWWAVSQLETGPCTPETCVDLIGSLRFHLHYNFGASFSTGAGFGRLFGFIAVIMTGVMLRAAWNAGDHLSSVLFGVIAGGASGNMLDRLFRAENGLMSGGVADFIDLQWWPIFNIADAAIVVGVVMLIVRQYSLDDPGDTADAADLRDAEDLTDPEGLEDTSEEPISAEITSAVQEDSTDDG